MNVVQNVVNYNISSNKPAFQKTQTLNSSHVMAGQNLSRSFVAANDEYDDEDEEEEKGRGGVTKILDFELEPHNVSVVVPPRTPYIPASIASSMQASLKANTRVEEYKVEKITNP